MRVKKEPSEQAKRLIENFESYLLENTTLQPSSILKYVNEIKYFFKQYPSLTVRNMRKHIIYLHRHSNNNRPKYAFKHFLTYINKKSVYYPLLPSLKNPSKKKLSQFPSPETVLAVLNNMPSGKYLDIAKLQIATGCRSMEIIGLRKEHINMDTLQALIKGKGNKTGYIQFQPVHKPILAKYCEGKVGFLFLGDACEKPYKNDPMKFERMARKVRDNYYQCVKRAARGVGADYFGTHSFRRAFSLEFYNLTTDIRALKEVLRHSNISTTMTYLPDHTEEVKETVKKVQNKFYLS